MTKGWALGTAGWRKALAKEHAHLALARGLPRQELRELQETPWQQALERLLAQVGKTRDEIQRERKGVAWKISVAEVLRRTTTATNAWIADALQMGAPNSVSQYLNWVRSGKVTIRILKH